MKPLVALELDARGLAIDNVRYIDEEGDACWFDVFVRETDVHRISEIQAVLEQNDFVVKGYQDGLG